jgi:hypothetical protein
MIDGKEAVAIASVLAGAFVCWVGVYGWGKWLARPRPIGVSETHDARLRRIEQAIEAIAIEVERIGEGQRFTTRLLGERARVDQEIIQAPARHRPIVTPH